MSGKALAVVLVLLIAGCTSPAAEPSPSESASAPPSLAPSPTETVDATDPANWVITFDGVGPISLGDDIDDARVNLVQFAEYGADYGCPWVAFFERGSSKLWFPLDESYQIVEQIVVTGGEGPATTDGIRPGATMAEVRAAYPDAVETTPNGDLAISDGARWIHFMPSEDLLGLIVVNSFSTPPYEFCG